MPKLKWFPVLGFLSLAACQRDTITTYTIPKEPGTPAVTAPLGMETGGLPEGHPPVGGEGMTAENASAQGVSPAARPQGRVTWTTPSGWREKPGSGFRYVSFDVPGRSGAVGDMSVVVLDGDGGGILANINRWRDQIGLPPLSEESLPRESRHFHIGNLHLTMINHLGTAAAETGKSKKRVLAAIAPVGDRVWFFKLVGEDSLVRGAEKDFMKFLESLRGLE